jgi:hypothetical protein
MASKLNKVLKLPPWPVVAADGRVDLFLYFNSACPSAGLIFGLGEGAGVDERKGVTSSIDRGEEE